MIITCFHLDEIINIKLILIRIRKTLKSWVLFDWLFISERLFCKNLSQLFAFFNFFFSSLNDNVLSKNRHWLRNSLNLLDQLLQNLDILFLLTIFTITFLEIFQNVFSKAIVIIQFILKYFCHIKWSCS